MTLPPHEHPDIQAYNRLMADSFHRFTGMSLAAGDMPLVQALWHAPHPIVSHGTEADPIFRYANAAALKLWEMDWDSFTRLPSRLSAEADSRIQSDRDALLKTTMRNGWVDDYAGIRISRTGRRFEIRDAVLWNVVDAAGVRHGQAAFIRDWRYI